MLADDQCHIRPFKLVFVATCDEQKGEITMEWIIVTDHLEEHPEDAKWFITADMPPGFTKATVDALPYEFRLLDDDGELYFSGKCGDLDNADQDHAFAPLDWAMNDSGCTRMDYRKVGEKEWKTL